MKNSCQGKNDQPKAPRCLNWLGNDPKQLKTQLNNEKFIPV